MKEKKRPPMQIKGTNSTTRNVQQKILMEEGSCVAAVATARPNAEKDTNHVNRVKDVNDVRGNPKSEGNVGVKPNNLIL